MEQTALASQIGKVLGDAGLDVAVSQTDGVITLAGYVNSAEARQAAEDIARSVAPRLRVDNALHVNPSLPTAIEDLGAKEPPPDVVATEGDEIEPDFTVLPPATDETEVLERGGVGFAPVDPVIATGARGEVQILGGFGTDSMASLEVDASAQDAEPGDEALAEAIRRELREDSATSGLEIDVFVRRGIAHLRGRVSGLEDVDNAESVAARVPGVQDVVEEIELPAR